MLIEVRCCRRAIQPSDHLIIKPRHSWLPRGVTLLAMVGCGEEWRGTMTSIYVVLSWFYGVMFVFGYISRSYINASPLVSRAYPRIRSA
jgi:hypothetical protein